MRNLHGHLAVASASALLLIAMTGCSTPPSTGSVVVSIGYDATQKSVPVEVTVTDEVGTVLAQETLNSGDTHTFADIALGPVTIDATGLCTLATTLSAAHPTATADFSPTNCRIG